METSNLKDKKAKDPLLYYPDFLVHLLLTTRGKRGEIQVNKKKKVKCPEQALSEDNKDKKRTRPTASFSASP